MTEEIEIGEKVREIGERVRRTIKMTRATIEATKEQLRLIRKSHAAEYDADKEWRGKTL